MERSIPEVLDAAASVHPDRIAIAAGDSSLTYRSLQAATRRLATRVHALAPRRGQRILTLIEDPARHVVALLGVLRARHAFVPIDPSDPRARIEAAATDALPVLVVTDRASVALARAVAGAVAVIAIDDAEDGGGAPDFDGPEPSPSPARAMACILYTSGSTGHPRGVVQTHRNLVRNFEKVATAMRVRVDDRVAMLGHPSHAAAQTDLFAALLSGATLVPYDLRRRGLDGLADWVARERVTILFMVPSIFRRFAERLAPDASFPTVRLAKLSGETVLRRDVETARRLFAPDARVLVSLGCTELNTVRRLFLEPTSTLDDPVVPVGDAVPDVVVRLVGEDGAPVAAGEVGRIIIESRDLFAGYWRRPHDTRAALRRDPNDPDLRVFRTNDLGRIRPDGRLVHVGRADDRIKRLGRGVDVGEIEAALVAIDGVREAAVTTVETTGPAKLVGHVAVAGGGLDAASIRACLADRLTIGAIPDRILTHASLPLLPNGKVDRARLATEDFAPPPIQSPASRGPVDRLAEQILDVLRRAARVPDLGAGDDLFERGVDSLAVLEAVHRLERTLGVAVPAALLLEAPSAAALARRLRAGGPLRSFVRIGPASSSRPPLVCVPGAGSDALVFRRLAARLVEQPILAFLYPGWDGSRPFASNVGEIAAELVTALRAERAGPYLLHGHSFGGVVAHEAAVRLAAADERVLLLSMVDTRAPSFARLARQSKLVRRLRGALRGGRRRVRRLLRGRTGGGNARRRLNAQKEACLDALREHVPRAFPGRILLLRSAAAFDANASLDERCLGWSGLARDEVDVVPIAGSRVAALRRNAAEGVASALEPRIVAAITAIDSVRKNDRETPRSRT